eukprot:2046603-Rhodomonas_salina.1
MFPPHPGSLLDAWPKGRHLILYDKTCDKLSENPAHALYYYTEPGDPAAIVVGPESLSCFRLHRLAPAAATSADADALSWGGAPGRMDERGARAA